MAFAWYADICESTSFEQGDIICDCKILLPNENHYAAIETGDDPEEPMDIIQSDVIILSQSCDLENSKIDSIIVCPITSLKACIVQHAHLKSKNGLEELRQGKLPSLHLLNQVSIEGRPDDFFVVNFHHIYSVPKSTLSTIVGSKSRKRLLPPYREHLSQSFARYFMRVGLPTDISKDSLQEYSQAMDK